MEEFFLLVRRGVTTIFKEGPIVFTRKCKQFLWLKPPLVYIFRGKKSIVLPSKRPTITPLKERVSVIIPVKNGGSLFRKALDALKSQKGLKDVEIVIIDSGSIDGTVRIAKQYTSHVYTIKPHEFHHARTRNYGVSLASGMYCVFTTADAVCDDNLLVYDMISTLKKDPRLGAVSCRQIPRDDADCMGRFHIWLHYDYFLNMRRDTVLWARSGLASSILKRKIADVTNNCAAYPRSLFSHYQFRAPIAEDLDFALQLVDDGFHIAHIVSHNVIHSHNAVASYFLKLSFKSAYTISEMLHSGRREWPPVPMEGFLLAIAELYDTILYFIFTFKRDPVLETKDACEFLARLPTFLATHLHREVTHLHGSLSDIISLSLGSIEGQHTSSNAIKGILLRAYRGTIHLFHKYLLSQDSRMYPADDFFETLEKIFATTAGTLLGEYLLFRRKNNRVDKLQECLEHLLDKLYT